MMPNVGPNSEIEFDVLKNLLNNESWPKAVDESAICNPALEDDKIQRAETILISLIDQPIKGKKILDYGCGEGHVSIVAGKDTSLSVGFDIKSSTSQIQWETITNNVLLTKDINKVKDSGPFDIIIAYDVIDHVTDPIATLQEIKSLANDQTKIYMRCHPWVGRHGGHLYQQINKAFIHLIFTPEELTKLGYTSDFTQKVLMPIITYHKWLSEVGFTILNGHTDRIPVEPIFERNPVLRQRIGSLEGGIFPRVQMEQTFHDYIVKI